MSITLQREKFYEDAIAFPATKAAAAATISSDIIYDFRDEALGAAEIELSALVPSSITDTITVQPYVSYDKGATWIKGAAAYTDLISSGGTAQITKIVLTSHDPADYSAKAFLVFSGTVPFIFWFDDTGAVPQPVLNGVDNSLFTFVKLDVSGGGALHASVDAWGTYVETVFETASGATFQSSWLTDTLSIATAERCASYPSMDLNLLDAPAVASSIGVSTIGKNIEAMKTIALAPTLRVDAIFDGTAELAVRHGCKVNVKMKELDVDYRKKIFADVLDLSSTVVNTANSYFEVISNSLYTDKIDPFYKIYLDIYCADTSKIINNVNYRLETSDDGVFWRLAAAEVTNFDNSTGVYHVVTEATTGTTYRLGSYARVRMYATDATGHLDLAHGIKANVVGVY